MRTKGKTAYIPPDVLTEIDKLMPDKLSFADCLRVILKIDKINLSTKYKVHMLDVGEKYVMNCTRYEYLALRAACKRAEKYYDRKFKMKKTKDIVEVLRVR